MKILILNHNVIGHGGYLIAYNYGKQLSLREHDVTLLAISENNRFGFETVAENGLHIVKTPDLLKGRLRSGWDPWDTLARMAYLLPKQYDLIHCADSRPVVILPALVLRNRRKIPLIIDWGDWWGRGGTIYERNGSGILDRLFAPVETYFEEAFLTRANGVSVLSKALEKRALSLGVQRDRLMKTDNGTDTENLKPIKRTSARDRLGLDLETPIVGYLGLIMKKDEELLISCFKEILRNRPDTRLCIIGNSNFSPKPKWVQSNQVFYTGVISYEDLNLYLAACDVMLLPLRNSIANAGRWPYKVCDYMAAGCAIVATSVGDMAYLFADGQKGILAKDDAQSLAEAVAQVLGDEKLKDELGQNARRYAEEHLDWKIQTTKLEEFYSRFI